jgi:ABC-type transport system substrate-binding protein
MKPDGDVGSRAGAPEHIGDRVIELIEQTRTETDQSARLEQFSELQQLTYEEVPVAYGYAPEEIFPIRNCVEGAHVAAWNRPHFKHWDTSNC